MKLSDLILQRFTGRADHIAVGNGDGFAPEQATITADRLDAEHLAGKRCLGFYVVNADNRVTCSCVDFDNKADAPDPDWQTKVEQVYLVLSKCGLSPLVELSQSGNGAHVWIFFGEPTEAWIARAWWRGLSHLTQIVFREIFPKQEALTGKGLGNLVRYPLWNNSQFVDVENGWQPLDPAAALEGVGVTSGMDLSMLAFQIGVGELQPEIKTSIVELPGVTIGNILPLRVQRLLDRKGGLLYRRWTGDTGGMKDPSRSALAMSLCVEMVRLYVPTPEIAAALRHWCANNGAADKGNRDDWINRTVAKAYDFIVTRQETQSMSAVTFQQACHMYLDRIETGGAFYLPSGVPELDHSIEGVGIGEVCIIAARPSHGKSAFAFQWLDYAAGMMIPGLIISEEMIASEIGKRRLSTISNVDQDNWVKASIAHIRGEVDNYHATRAPTYIVEGCSSIDRAEEVIDQFCMMHGVGIVAVDYLQLLGSRGAERYEVVTEVSRRIKQATLRNGCRTLLLSQMNRQVEGRPDYEPKMSDLRESGQIEQDADLILFPQWPKMFDADIAEEVYRITVAKRRNGAIKERRVETTFNAKKQSFGAAPAPLVEDPRFKAAMVPDLQVKAPRPPLSEILADFCPPEQCPV